MKYTEFEAKVKGVNSTWEVIHNGSLTIVTNNEGRPFVCVSSLRIYGLDTNYSERWELVESEANMLTRLAYELASTPLKEREEPKKYYYRLPYVRAPRSYLNYVMKDGTLFYDNGSLTVTHKTQFTREEFATIAKEHDIPANLHIEEEIN